jgi:hypothetical protein
MCFILPVPLWHNTYHYLTLRQCAFSCIWWFTRQMMIMSLNNTFHFVIKIQYISCKAWNYFLWLVSFRLLTYMQMSASICAKTSRQAGTCVIWTLFCVWHIDCLTDITLTAHRQHTDSTPTAHRQHTDSTRTAHGQHTDSTLTAHRQHTDSTLTDSTPTAHWQHTDSTPTAHWQHTDSTLTAHRQHTDSTPTAHRQHTDTMLCYFR